MIDKIDLGIIAKNHLKPAHTAAIIDLCSRAFEEDYTPFLEMFDDSVHVLAEYEGILVSHALWITRWLQIGQNPMLRTAYVEGVATDKRFRGKGLATKAMERLVAEIYDFDIAALSPAETTLYSRLGWEYWQGPLFHRKSGDFIPEPEDESVMICRLPKTPELDLSLPISIEWRPGEVW
jgi:aminoglycoside 2'-N-acetyltransferase I